VVYPVLDETVGLVTAEPVTAKQYNVPEVSEPTAEPTVNVTPEPVEPVSVPGNTVAPLKKLVQPVVVTVGEAVQLKPEPVLKATVRVEAESAAPALNATHTAEAAAESIFVSTTEVWVMVVAADALGMTTGSPPAINSATSKKATNLKLNFFLPPLFIFI
jgi:hypothetical protein